jgi:uncharacterized protein (TIGR02611 family)
VKPYGSLVPPERPLDDPRIEPSVAPEAEHRDGGILARLKRGANGLRSWVQARPGGAQTWRVGVALTGLVVIIVGIVLLAVPGPGWLVIFAGLGIWATEFAWAKSLLTFVRRSVGAWTAWLSRQPRWLAVLVGALGLIVLAAVAWGAWTLVR